MKIAIRGYGDGQLIFEERVDVAGTDPTELTRYAQRHVEMLAKYERNMIEVEFLDEPDVDQRFLRFGTDANGMVIPIGIDLSGGGMVN